MILRLHFQTALQTCHNAEIKITMVQGAVLTMEINGDQDFIQTHGYNTIKMTSKRHFMVEHSQLLHKQPMKMITVIVKESINTKNKEKH